MESVYFLTIKNSSNQIMYCGTIKLNEEEKKAFIAFLNTSNCTYILSFAN